MNITITPNKLTGRVTPPPSKSMAHRLVIAAALSAGESTLRNVAFSQDVQATLRCVSALGAAWERDELGGLRIRGIGGKPYCGEEVPVFHCGESGSTLRFMIPIALAIAGGGKFTGEGRLMERPLEPYFQMFARQGIAWRQEDGFLEIRGKLSPGRYDLAGNVSSQFFTGLLFALPLLDGPSKLCSIGALESASYAGMTVQALEQAGICVEQKANEPVFLVNPGVYRGFDAEIEADWSQAAFWYAANALGSDLEIEGLHALSAQGDMVIVPHYLRLTRPGDLEIDLSNCPDLLPPLAVMAAVRQGTTRFINAARLRLKESDRLTTVAAMISALGGSVEEQPAGLVVSGVPKLAGGVVDGANDHRIVMAAAVAAAAGPVTIQGAEAVKKSYPNFWEEYERLGGKFHVQ